jgi:hypothetical protein
MIVQVGAGFESDRGVKGRRLMIHWKFFDEKQNTRRSKKSETSNEGETSWGHGILSRSSIASFRSIDPKFGD